MAFVSFPCLLVLLVSDQHVLECALINVERDGVLVMSEKARQQLAERWKPLFLTINLVAQAVGLLVGLAIVYLNWIAVKQAPTWQVNSGQFVIAGYVYLYCVFIFYSAIAVYSLRVVALSLFLRDIATYADLDMLPLHPDRSGGLRPIGHLGLRNQYLLSVTSINIILVFIYFSYTISVNAHTFDPDQCYYYGRRHNCRISDPRPCCFFGALVAFSAGYAAEQDATHE